MESRKEIFAMAREMDVAWEDAIQSVQTAILCAITDEAYMGQLSRARDWYFILRELERMGLH